MLNFFIPAKFRNRQLLALLIYHFITSIQIFMPVIIPFFTLWGKLNMTQILTLQSIFLSVSLIAEVPTGVIADKFGKKVSLILADLFFMTGSLLYASVASFPVFIVAESLMGIGRAFFSGAAEALEYDSLKELKIEDEYLNFLSKKRTAQLIGNILSGILAFLLAKIIFIRYFLVIYAVIEFIGVLILLFFVHEPKFEDESFVPNYKRIIIEAIKNFKINKYLINLTLLSFGIFVASYFQYWLYQKILLNQGMNYSYFGILTIFIYLLGIIFAQNLPTTYSRFGLKKLTFSVLTFTLLFQILIFLNLIPNLYLLASILAILIALLKESTFLPNKAINELTKSEIRSTVLSFISLIKSLGIAVLNPLIGFVANTNPTLALLTSGFLACILIFLAFYLKLSDQNHSLNRLID